MIASSRLAGAMMMPTSSAQWPKVFGPEAPGPKSRRAPPAGRGSVAGTATNLSARTVTNAFAQNVNFLSLQYLSLRPFPMVLKQLYTTRYAYGSSRARTTYSLAYRCTPRPGGRRPAAPPQPRPLSRCSGIRSFVTLLAAGLVWSAVLSSRFAGSNRSLLKIQFIV